MRTVSVPRDPRNFTRFHRIAGIRDAINGKFISKFGPGFLTYDSEVIKFHFFNLPDTKGIDRVIRRMENNNKIFL